MNYYLRNDATYIERFSKGHFSFYVGFKTYGLYDINGHRLYTRNGRISSKSILANYLTSLLGADKEIKLSKEDAKVMTTVFRHTRHWSLWQKAWEILDKKGQKKNLEFLREHTAVFFLQDKLEGRYFEHWLVE